MALKSIKSSDFFLVFVACLSLFALGWMDNARGPFFPLFLKNTGLSASKGALFFALTSFVSIASAASAGFFLKRFHLKALLFSGGLMMFLSPLGLVFFANFRGSIITALFFGIGLGWTAVGQNILISLIENKSLRRRFFSLLHCFYALAAMTAPLSLVWLHKVFQWNYLLLGVSFLCLPFLTSLLFFKAQEKSKDVKSQVQPPSLKNPWVLLWLSFLSFYISAELILTTRLVVLAEAFGHSFEVSSAHLFYFFLAMFVSRAIFFVFKIHWSTQRVLFICLLGIFTSFLLGFYYESYFLSLIGFFMGPIFPVVVDQIAETWPESFDVLISRVISISSFFVVMSHILVGYLSDLLGIETSIWSVFALSFLAFLVLILMFFKKNKSRA